MRTWLASLLIVASAAQVSAAEITDAGSDIYLTGNIVRGDATKFKEIAQRIAHGRVHLQSEGGSVADAVIIGDYIRAHSFQTYVHDDGICLSACGFTWLAGVPRHVGTNAHIGFHGSYNSVTKQPNTAGNAVIGAYLSRLGFGYATIIFLTEKPPKDMEVLTSETAQQYGIYAVNTPDNVTNEDPYQAPQGAAPAPQERLGDMNSWRAQWSTCLQDPTGTVDQNFSWASNLWLTECTIVRGAVRYKMATYTRWYQTFDYKACAQTLNRTNGIAICRDYLDGLYTCAADYNPWDPFLYASPCTPAHWALLNPQRG